MNLFFYFNLNVVSSSRYTLNEKKKKKQSKKNKQDSPVLHTYIHGCSVIVLWDNKKDVRGGFLFVLLQFVYKDHLFNSFSSHNCGAAWTLSHVFTSLNLS